MSSSSSRPSAGAVSNAADAGSNPGGTRLTNIRSIMGGPRKGPRLGDLSVQTSSYGSMVPRIYGTMRVAGTVVWATELKEESAFQGDGKSGPETVAYTYSASFAVALSSRPAARIKRIWADGKLLRGAAGDFKVSTGFRFYPGSEGQEVDPLIASVEGVERTPAYRGLALAVFEDLQLAEFGNRIPSITFELEADDDGIELGALLADASGRIIRSADARRLVGYAAHGKDVSDAVAPLVEAFDVELREQEGALQSPDDHTVRILAEDDLGADADIGGSPRIERSQVPATSLPSALTLNYYDPVRDYQAGQARASIPSVSRVARQMLLPCALDANEAKGLAGTQIARTWATRERLTLRLPAQHCGLSPGMLVRVPGAPGDWVIDQASLERFVVRLVVRPAWKSAEARIADPGRGLPQPDIVAAPTALALFDLPEPDSGQPTLHLAAASPSGAWRPVPISIAVNGVITTGQSAPAEAILGETLTALSTGQAALMDLAGQVDVRLANVDHWLQARDDVALAAGANLAMIGDEAIQFGSVQPIGEGRFRLSRLLRGRRGTEWAMAGHAAGEPFVLLESGSLRPIPVPIEMMGGLVSVTAHGRGDGSDPNAVSRAANGEALRPLSPAHLAAVRESGGSLIVHWVRRSRQGWAWLDEVDIPLDPQMQGYRVKLSGAAATIERSSTVEQVTISAPEVATMGAGPITIDVRQVGPMALSHEATIIFDNA